VLQRILRLALRAGGWLLTPIIVVLAATLGATIATLPSASFSPTTALVIAAVGGVLGAGLGLWLWTRLLRQSPELRDVLHVTPEGVPTEEAMTDVLGQDRSSERDGA
jgi:hypothetical protein